MKKKISGLISFVMLTVLTLSGCSNGGGDKKNTETGGTGNKPVEITIANWAKDNQPTRKELYNKYLEEMKKKYPEVTIKPDQWTYDVSTFLPKAASRQLPTMYVTYFTELDKIINAGYAADITDAMKKYSYDTSIDPKYLDLIKKDSKLYGIPYNGYILGLMYNIQLMKQAGEVDANGNLKYPQTYQELAELAKRIKDKTGKAGFFIETTKNYGGWKFMSIAWSFGAEFEKKINGKWTATFNSPEAVEALQYIKDLKWKYNALPDNMLLDEDEFSKELATDQVAIGLTASDKANTIVNNYKMNKDNIAMSKLPTGPKGRVALLGGNVYMFSPDATPEQIDACFKWLEITGDSPKVTEELKQTWGNTYKTERDQNHVVGPETLSTWINADRVNAKAEVKKPYINIDMNLFKDYMNTDGITVKPEEPMNTQELYNVLDVVIQGVLSKQDADPKEWLDKAANDFQKNYLDKVNQ